MHLNLSFIQQSMDGLFLHLNLRNDGSFTLACGWV